MKVLFINPYSGANLINIALGNLSAFLKKYGHMVKVIDLNNNRQKDVFNFVKRVTLTWKPELIGICVHSLTYNISGQLAEFIRAVTKTPIMVGGPQITYEGEEILREFPSVDYAVIGEGEWTILELIHHYNNGKDLKEIKGLAYRDRNEKIERNPAREKIEHLDSLPYPDYSSFGIFKITDYWLLSSRGCPYDCNFCLRISGKKWRAASPTYIIGELKNAMEKYSIERFSFVDALFNLKISRVEKFCEKLIEERLNLPWRCLGVRANLVSESMVSAMKNAGCEQVGIGIETLDPEVFKEVKKGETIERIIEGIRLFKNHGIQVHGFLVIGLPYDTYEKTMRTFVNTRSLKLDSEIWQLLVPYPGSRVYDWYKKYGTIHRDYKKTDMVDFSGKLNENVVACDTPGFTRAERIKAYNLISWKTKSYPTPPGVRRISLVLYIMKNIWKYDRKNFLSHISFCIKKGLGVLIKGKLFKETGPEIKFTPDPF